LFSFQQRETTLSVTGTTLFLFNPIIIEYILDFLCFMVEWLGMCMTDERRRAETGRRVSDTWRRHEKSHAANLFIGCDMA